MKNKYLLLVGAVLAFFSTQACKAAVLLTVDNINITSSSSVINGTFDVYFSISGSSPAISGYDFVMDISPAASGVSFNGASNPSSSGSHPPLFSSGSPFVASTSPSFKVTDFLSSGSATPNDGTGLVTVQYSVAANTVGNFTLSINTTSTILSDPSANPITFSVQNGTLSVVPEPVSTAIVGFALAATCIWRRCRRLQNAA